MAEDKVDLKEKEAGKETVKQSEDSPPQTTSDNTENNKAVGENEQQMTEQIPKLEEPLQITEKQENVTPKEEPLQVTAKQESVKAKDQISETKDDKSIESKGDVASKSQDSNGKREKKKNRNKSKGSITSDEEESNTEKLKYGAIHVIQLFIPTSICMLFVIITVQSLPYYADDTSVSLPYIPFSEKSDDDGERILSAIGNAAILLAILVVATFVIILLYKCRCYIVIYIWLIFSSANILSFLTITYYNEIFREFNIVVDYVTIFFVTWNVSAVGMISIFWNAPLRLQQAYLIYVSVITALIFIKFLPPWTTWVVLGLLVIWDLVAVLCPFGPLRMLIETAKERNEPIFPALIYSSFVYMNVLETQFKGKGKSEQQINAKDMQKQEIVKSLSKKSSDDGQAPGVKLGLGDFIFYSVLIGKVSKQGDWNTTLACYVAILMGLSLTLILLAIYKKALPALPISLTFGLIFYSCTSIFVQPFSSALTDSQVYI
ncbi:hypothetical protein B4U80_04038 [Leptotrombidium deliense]|uniref:Presenilin n=1 Tax=Leptotrombidium deliense TaxID=299467 RepID=A0A443SET6_9ACAR|nr:hypothetical protein B4U80_04038 [Leptotrombidium deliense]